MWWRLKKHRWLLGLWAAGMLLALISACAGRDQEQTLVHPAVTVAKSARKLAFLEPVWSPDGTLLVSTGLSRCPLGNCIFGVYIVNPETGSPRPLVKPNAQSRPAWTREPETVSFISDTVIYTATLDGET